MFIFGVFGIEAPLGHVWWHTYLVLGDSWSWRTILQPSPTMTTENTQRFSPEDGQGSKQKNHLANPVSLRLKVNMDKYVSMVKFLHTLRMDSIGLVSAASNNQFSHFSGVKSSMTPTPTPVHLRIQNEKSVEFELRPRCRQRFLFCQLLEPFSIQLIGLGVHLR